MALQHSTVLVVSTNDDLVRLERDFAEFSDDTVLLEISSDAEVLNTAADFRWLRQAARDSRINLEISTDDPLRLELAGIFGIAVSGETTYNRSITRFVQPDQPTVERLARHDQSTVHSVNPAGGSLHEADTIPSLNHDLAAATAHGSQEEAATDPASRASESEPSFSFVIAPPVPRRPDLEYEPQDTWAAAEPGPISRPASRGRTLSRGAVIGTVVTTAILAAIAVVLVGFLAPAARITLVPATNPVAADLTYGVAGTGQSFDLSVNPSQISTTQTYEATIPTTGERFVPDATATGTVLFTNSQTSEVTVPAGSILTAAGGMQFVTEEDVVVPAADPFGSLTFGSVTGAVRAQEPGTVGNVEAGSLSGQLESGIFYNNREPIGGGTDTRIPVVTEADLDALRSQAESDLLGNPAQAVQGELGDGQELVSGSVESSDMQVSFNHSAGEDAETVSIISSVEHNGKAYTPADLHEQAREAAGEQLPAQTGPDQVLLGDSIQISEPKPLGSDSAGYRIEASAQSRAVLSEAELDRLRAGLLGASESEAEALVADFSGVEHFDVHYGPDWLPVGKEPRLKSRITIEIQNEKQAATQ